MNQIDLIGKRAVITGGAQGIGRAVAERLLASGAMVSLWDRDEELVHSTAAELATRATVHAMAADVGWVAQCARRARFESEAPQPSWSAAKDGGTFSATSRSRRVSRAR